MGPPSQSQTARFWHTSHKEAEKGFCIDGVLFGWNWRASSKQFPKSLTRLATSVCRPFHLARCRFAATFRCTVESVLDATLSTSQSPQQQELNLEDALQQLLLFIFASSTSQLCSSTSIPRGL
eukprot:6486605-Amphidinium_carterae.3